MCHLSSLPQRIRKLSFAAAQDSEYSCFLIKLQRMTVHGEPKHIILLQLSDDLQGTPAATKSGTAATIVIELERFPA